MAERTRDEGWQHAKLSGHKNEDLVTELISTNPTVQAEIMRYADKSGRIAGVSEGGLYETNVPSVFDDTTKSKPDIRLCIDDGSHINISLKKSFGGQVYLISTERFIDGFELQYHTKVPEKVRRAISLFWGSADDTDEIISKYATVAVDYQKRKHRLVKDTLDKYDPTLSEVLQDWFKENIVEIFDFCFARGLAKNEDDWADIVWYKNLLNDEDDGDTMFKLHDLKNKIRANKHLVVYGSRNGGTTIQLPFGFVQWHQDKMQFHHSLSILQSLQSASDTDLVEDNL